MKLLQIVFICVICTDTLVVAQDESPRLSTEHDTSTITIHSSNDPYGVFSIQVEGTGRVVEPSSIVLVITRAGGTFGQVSVRVRTVGGGEPWDDLIDVASTNNQPNTIGEVLAARNQSRQAIAGQDYQRLDTLVQFEEGATRSSVTLYISDDTVPEDDENLFIYIEALTRGARIARPSIDNGLKGFAEVVIVKNDYWNGWLGFYPSNSTWVTADEDSGVPVQLTVERRNASFQYIQLYWRALVEPDVQSVRSDRIDLLQQLITTTGSIECPSGQRLCNFNIAINNDQIPENTTWFTVELYLNPLMAEQGARIDPNRRYANVTILPSDNPNGLVQFTKQSRYIYVDRLQDSVAVRVERKGYSAKQVSVVYSTTQLHRPVNLAGTRIYHALEGSDYNKATGTLVFEPGEVEKTVLISRDPFKASDNPYPKMFNIELKDLSSGADLGVSLASVTITDQSDVAIWQLWAEAQTKLNNNTIDDLMRKLTSASVSRDLTSRQLDIVMNLMDDVLLAAAENAPLQAGVRSSIMRVMCDMLDPERRDAVRGRWRLSRAMDQFAFSYVAHLACDTCCQETFLDSPSCPHVKFIVAKRYPEDINNYRWNARDRDSFSVAPGLLRVSDHGRNSPNPKCYPIVLMDYQSDLWFTTRTTPNILLNNKVLSLKIKEEVSRILSQPISFRIHTSGKGAPARRSECVYFDEDIQQWTSQTQYGRSVCSVKNNLALALDNYVDCGCHHLSLYAVKSDLRNPDMIGYPIWFHISCFICMAGLALSILAHHVCIYTRFAASLLMHMCFAVLGTEVCYVIDAYLSSYHLLNISETENNYRCIVMSLFLHYFFMAQFTWMMAQAVNYFKILVLNDEHTERKLLVYILLGWGLPILLVAVFYIVTYLIYRFLTDLPPDRIYGDVTANGDICFVTSPIAGLAGIMAPCFIFVMVVGIVFIQAYQVSPQWQSYDDIYKGRHNIHEVRFILLLFTLIVLTWLFGGLHMAYGQLWMLAFFCVFNITMGIYVFVLYTALRTPCATCMAQQKAVYGINDLQTEAAEVQYPGSEVHYPTVDRRVPGSVHGSQHNLVMHEEPWEKESITLPNETAHTNSMLRVKRSAPNTNIYVVPPTQYSDQKIYSAEQQDSQDLNDLILALRAGEVLTSSDSFNPLDSGDITTNGSVVSNLERKRISIADTHL